ncbi:MAG: SH3 domain-containing protein [Treponema sp.]|nr:SH3 domain-containing protein [Treponema sp.]
MKKHGFLWLVLAVVSVSLLAAGCGAGFGKVKTFHGTEVYYTSAVTESEVDLLGAFLITEGFADGDVQTVQLSKTGETFEFRIVIERDEEEDLFLREILQEFAIILSQNVFNGSPVDIHLCDERLQTLVVIPMPPAIAIRNQTGNTGIFLYISPASSNDAGSNVLDYWLDHGDSMTYILPFPINVENTYNIRMVSNELEVFTKLNMPVTQGGTITMTSSDLFDSGRSFMTTANLRLRSEPDTRSDDNILIVVPRYTEVLYLASGRRDTIDGRTAPWILVMNEDGIAGWAFSGYLENWDYF